MKNIKNRAWGVSFVIVAFLGLADILGSYFTYLYSSGTELGLLLIVVIPLCYILLRYFQRGFSLLFFKKEDNDKFLSTSSLGKRFRFVSLITKEVPFENQRTKKQTDNRPNILESDIWLFGRILLAFLLIFISFKLSKSASGSMGASMIFGSVAFYFIPVYILYDVSFSLMRRKCPLSTLKKLFFVLIFFEIVATVAIGSDFKRVQYARQSERIRMERKDSVKEKIRSLHVGSTYENFISVKDYGNSLGAEYFFEGIDLDGLTSVIENINFDLSHLSDGSTVPKEKRKENIMRKIQVFYLLKQIESCSGSIRMLRTSYGHYFLFAGGKLIYRDLRGDFPSFEYEYELSPTVFNNQYLGTINICGKDTGISEVFIRSELKDYDNPWADKVNINREFLEQEFNKAIHSKTFIPVN